jgi:hypothetical protein
LESGQAIPWIERRTGLRLAESQKAAVAIAQIAADAKAFDALCAAELSYSHSDGRVEERRGPEAGDHTGPDLRMRGLAMSDTTESNDERPCLHCLIGDVIDDFYDDYGSLSGEKDTIDVDEIVTALAKTVAEMTFGSDAALRQRILEDLMRGISQFEAEFANAPASDVRH